MSRGRVAGYFEHTTGPPDEQQLETMSTDTTNPEQTNRTRSALNYAKDAFLTMTEITRLVLNVLLTGFWGYVGLIVNDVSVSARAYMSAARNFENGHYVAGAIDVITGYIHAYGAVMWATMFSASTKKIVAAAAKKHATRRGLAAAVARASLPLLGLLAIGYCFYLIFISDFDEVADQFSDIDVDGVDN